LKRLCEKMRWWRVFIEVESELESELESEM